MDPTSDTRTWVNHKKAAELTGRCERTIHRWLKAEKIVGIKPLGLREWLVDADSAARRVQGRDNNGEMHTDP